MHLFYTPDIIGDSYTLSEDESKHCIRVLRLSLMDKIQLTDGKGNFYLAEISDDNPKSTTVHVIEAKNNFGKRNHYLHIAVAPTKNTDRMEWFLEKATEIGIDEITPIECDHSERSVVKTERLNKVIVAAMKQSQKAYLPKLNELTKINQLLSSSFSGQKYIAHCREDADKKSLSKIYSPGTNALILIGPEGDFSEEEIALAKKNNFIPVSLGNSRLRTETAALVACHTIELMSLA